MVSASQPNAPHPGVERPSPTTPLITNNNPTLELNQRFGPINETARKRHSVDNSCPIPSVSKKMKMAGIDLSLEADYMKNGQSNQLHPCPTTQSALK
jgi:hypothetical protein